MRARRPLAALVACTFALGLAACNEGHDPLVGETEGAYLDIGHLKYQVQMSRILNEADIEDVAYLEAVPEDERELEEGELWFGVWVRAENVTEEPAQRATEFEIRDTQGQTWEPISQPENILAWEWQPVTVPPRGVQGYVPRPDSIPNQATINGSLLLFKLPYASLENRPLELEITSPDDATVVGRVNLDV
jgi:hypothetical protein